MRVWKSIAEWRTHRETIAAKSIGFVATMGALHRGHAALVERCRAENEIAVVSIFVNPSQFNDPNDLARYPNTLESDLTLLQKLGVDDVFVPTAAEMYPQGYRMKVQPDERYRIMEGLHRPGFLEGVATVVLKLLEIVRPEKAYFGEKDYQQLMLIRDLVAEFFLPCKIVACPTVRAESGLAESSRNALLSPAAREKAPVSTWARIAAASSPAAVAASASTLQSWMSRPSRQYAASTNA